MLFAFVLAFVLVKLDLIKPLKSLRQKLAPFLADFFGGIHGSKFVSTNIYINYFVWVKVSVF